MRILFITHYFAPDSGAAPNRLTRLAQKLQNRGHQVTVLTTMPHYPTGTILDAYRGRFVVAEDRDGLRVIQVWLWTTKSSSAFWRLLSQLSFMMTCILRGIFVPQPDVVFIENQPIFTGLAGWFIAKIKRRQYVLNVSDYWPEYLAVAGVVSEQSLIYRVFKWLTNLTQRSAHTIVALLDDLLARIENRIGDVNGRVIYNAVDLDTLHPDADGTPFRQKYALGNARLVTFLGGLGPHIDVGTMLEAVKNIRRDDVRFVFVGTGAQKATLTAALQQPEFDHCHYIEWIDASELPSFWAASDIHFWALHDNELDRMRFQAKLYEALASGTPTVIAVEGLMSEILRRTDTGITVAPYDAVALRNEIVRLLDDAEHHHRVSQNARTYAEANFDIEKTVDAYEAVLRDAAEQTNPDTSSL